MRAAKEDVSASVVAELAHRLGFRAPPRLGARWVRATSTVVRWGDDLTVKIPHRDPQAVLACLVHARVRSAAQYLGVSVAEVLAVEDLGPLLDRPLIISRFLHGDRLAPGDTTHDVWSSVGVQLAKLHAATAADMPTGLRVFTQTPAVDPGLLADQLHTSGRLTEQLARRVQQLRDALLEQVVAGDRLVLCRGDIHAGNVIAADGRFVGLVDFAGAGWLDAAWDFVGVPVDGVSAMLDEYRAASGRTASLLERIAWCRLQTTLHRAASSTHAGSDTVRVIGEVDQLMR